MKEIKLTQGKVALVDDEDFEYLNQYSWCFEHGYAARKNKDRTEYMHHLVLKKKEGLHRDHVNRNGLDNRKHNLRYATASQNCCNRPAREGSRSKYKGVVYNNRPKRLKRWVAHIRFNKKAKTIGYYKTEEEAALAYNEHAKRLHKDFAVLNEVN